MEQEKPEQEKPENLFPDFDVSFEDVELPEETTEDDVIDTDEAKGEESTYVEAADETAIGVYKTLQDKEILFDDEENPFDGTWESLEKHLDTLPDKIASSLLEQMPDPAQKLMDFALNKENLTHEDLKEFFKLEDKDYQSSNLEIGTLEDARAYLSNKMKQQGYEPDIIDVTLDAYEDKGEEYITNKAKTMSTKERTNLAATQLEQLKQTKIDNQVAQQKYFTSINNELTNLEYSDSRNKAIKDNLNPRVISAKNSAIQGSPKAIIQLADFYSYFDSKTGEFNLDAFSKMAKSKEVKGIKDNLMAKNFSSSGTKNSGKRHQSTSEGDEFVPVF